MQTQTLSSNETDSQESQTLRDSSDNASATEKSVSRWTSDRRERLRCGFFNRKKLSVVHEGQVSTATVVDSNDHGLGLELAIPLEVNAAVSFSGVGLQGRAHVRHCRRVDDNVFRVGLHLEAVSFHQTDTSRPTTALDPVRASEPNGGRDSDAVEKSTSDGAGAEPAEDLVNLANRVEEAPVGASDAGKSAGFALASIAPRKVGAPAEDQVPFETVVSSILSNPAAQPAEASKPERLEDEAIEPAAQEQRGTALDEIFAEWPETRQQIERLELNVSEQHATVAAAVTSLVKFVSSQQAELSTLKTSVKNLSKELRNVGLQLDLVTQVLSPAEKPKV